MQLCLRDSSVNEPPSLKVSYLFHVCLPYIAFKNISDRHPMDFWKWKHLRWHLVARPRGHITLSPRPLFEWLSFRTCAERRKRLTSLGKEGRKEMAEVGGEATRLFDAKRVGILIFMSVCSFSQSVCTTTVGLFFHFLSSGCFYFIYIVWLALPAMTSSLYWSYLLTISCQYMNWPPCFIGRICGIPKRALIIVSDNVQSKWYNFHRNLTCLICSVKRVKIHNTARFIHEFLLRSRTDTGPSGC